MQNSLKHLPLSLRTCLAFALGLVLLGRASSSWAYFKGEDFEIISKDDRVNTTFREDSDNNFFEHNSVITLTFQDKERSIMLETTKAVELYHAIKDALKRGDRLKLVKLDPTLHFVNIQEKDIVLLPSEKKSSAMPDTAGIAQQLEQARINAKAADARVAELTRRLGAAQGLDFDNSICKVPAAQLAPIQPESLKTPASAKPKRRHSQASRGGGWGKGLLNVPTIESSTYDSDTCYQSDEFGSFCGTGRGGGGHHHHDQGYPTTVPLQSSPIHVDPLHRAAGGE